MWALDGEPGIQMSSGFTFPNHCLCFSWSTSSIFSFSELIATISSLSLLMQKAISVALPKAGYWLLFVPHAQPSVFGVGDTMTLEPRERSEKKNKSSKNIRMFGQKGGSSPLCATCMQRELLTVTVTGWGLATDLKITDWLVHVITFGKTGRHIFRKSMCMHLSEVKGKCPHQHRTSMHWVGSTWARRQEVKPQLSQDQYWIKVKC